MNETVYLLMETEISTIEFNCAEYGSHNIYIYLFLFIEASKDTVEKLEQHLRLLKAEYTKLQKNYAELERKYSKAAAASGENDMGEFSSFVSRLAMTVATLYGRKTYSDITIRLTDKTVPGHKFVLNARSEEWSEDVLADSSELGKRRVNLAAVD